MSMNLLTVVGPTASGKTSLGVELARRLGGEIISADSRQVFRGMDLGTGKDLEEYGEIPHHLIDILEPGEAFSVFDFQRRFHGAFADIESRGRLPILVGGTGLYLDAVLRGYQLVEVPENRALRAELAPLPLEALASRLLALKPELHNTTDTLDRDRLVRAIEIAKGEACAPPPPELPPLSPLVLGLHWEPEMLRKRIDLRLRQRLDAGMVEEVAALHASGTPWETLEFYGLEYRFIARHLQGELNRNDMYQQLRSAITQFAKRQRTWFRRMEKQGVVIHWLDGRNPLPQALEIIGSQAIPGSAL